MEKAARPGEISEPSYSTMAREIKTLQIFQAGTHTAMSGDEVTIDRSQLARSAAAYRPALHSAPLVLGHPQLDAPRYGDVVSLFMNGDGLFAEAEIDPDLVDWVRKKRYTSVSAAFYPPNHPSNPGPGTWYLKHVGLLGATAPAVRGMQPLAFSAGSPQPINPVVADAERRAREQSGLRPVAALEFSESFSSNPVVADAERRAREAARNPQGISGYFLFSK